MKRRLAGPLAALLAGLLFGSGLVISGMTRPSKVQGFLDLSGAWDPSLALVMAAALAVTALLFRVARQQGHSLLGAPLHWPAARAIDGRLLAGGATFGIGWGLAGFCPGPAIVSLAGGSADVLCFVAAMLAGMWLYDRLEAAGLKA